MPLDIQKKEKKAIVYIKRYWPWLSTGVFMIFLLLLLSPYAFRPWTKYPAPLRAELAWRRFVASFSSFCHEDCLAERQANANIWRPYYLSNQATADNAYRKAFAGDNIELQSALVKIIAADGKGALPEILADIIANPDKSDELKRKIVIAFPEAFNNEDWLASLRQKAIDIEADAGERQYAVKLLAAYPDERNIRMIKELLIKEDSQEVFLAAFQTISIWAPDEVRWTEEELDRLMVKLPSDPKPMRWRRLWLITGRTRLENIANDMRLDDISRGLAAESLRQRFMVDIITPEPSFEDWQEYYENI